MCWKESIAFGWSCNSVSKRCYNCCWREFFYGNHGLYYCNECCVCETSNDAPEKAPADDEEVEPQSSIRFIYLNCIINQSTQLRLIWFKLMKPGSKFTNKSGWTFFPNSAASYFITSSQLKKYAFSSKKKKKKHFSWIIPSFCSCPHKITFVIQSAISARQITVSWCCSHLSISFQLGFHHLQT